MPFIDFQQQPDFKLDPRSVCIIGSGPGGAIPAVLLAKKGVPVVVLECGDFTPSYAMDGWVDEVNIEGGASPRFGFSKQLGGASNLWAGRVAPLESADFKSWPISLDDLQPYYDQAAQILNVSSEKFNAPPNPVHDLANWNTLKKDGEIELKFFQWCSKPFNALQYLQAHECENLTVLYNAPVKTLSIADNHIQTACVYHAPTKEIIQLHASRFILAAGGLETPRILLNSGIGGSATGQFFSTHPKADIATLMLNKTVKTNNPLFSDDVNNAMGVRFGVGLKENSGTLNHYVQLSPIVEYQANKLFESLKNSRSLNSGFIDKNRALRGFLPGLGHMVYEIMRRTSGLQKRSKRFILRGFLDQFPNTEHAISLSDTKDDAGYAQLKIEWKYTNKDRQDFLKFLQKLDTSFRKHDIGSIDFEPIKHMDQWPLIGIHSHFMGTTRMGLDHNTSVTDKNAKVHSVENLYISGPSLFSAYGFANPVYTIVALGCRLADHIISHMSNDDL